MTITLLLLQTQRQICSYITPWPCSMTRKLPRGACMRALILPGQRTKARSIKEYPNMYLSSGVHQAAPIALYRKLAALELYAAEPHCKYHGNGGPHMIFWNWITWWAIAAPSGNLLVGWGAAEGSFGVFTANIPRRWGYGVAEEIYAIYVYWWMRYYSISAAFAKTMFEGLG